MESMTNITARPSPEPSHPLQDFLRIPWANVLYLGSAMSILTGVSMVIRPIYDRQDLALEKFGVLGALNGYEIALLVVTLALIIWRNITRDAVALVVLMSAFLVGSAATLDTVAPGYAIAAISLGVGGFLAAIAKGWLVSAYAIGRFTRLQWVGLALAVAWNFLAPGVLGIILSKGGLPEHLRPVWIIGSWTILLAIACVIHDTTRTLPNRAEQYSNADLPGELHSKGDKPFLGSPLMRWIVLGMILACTLLHQWALAWSFNFPIEAGDLWLCVALLGVLACEIQRTIGKRSWKFDLFILSVVFLFGFDVLRSEAYSANITQPLEIISHLPLAMIAVGLLIESRAWIGIKRHWLHLPALAYAGAGAAWLGSDMHVTINRGWLLIGASFILLAIGAAVSLATHVPTAGDSQTQGS